ncbi:proteasome assembly chaperone 3-like [Centruroides sculpturatus]|uniref:proteasome assembly chaperone 3-like n=1 Tax=Centruroides sculpturatus TaxID=218467 RepID=UPI000C6EC77B|nr:proteasome assembly chaperone 3-like [Centruroides sculpturatus]
MIIMEDDFNTCELETNTFQTRNIHNKPPYKTKAGQEIINGHHTDIIVTEYLDQLFIIITQYDKMGTIIQVKQDSSDESKNIIYSTQVLFGQDELEINAVARNLMEKLNVSKSVIFSLALKDCSSSTIHQLGDMLNSKLKPIN